MHRLLVALVAVAVFSACGLFTVQTSTSTTPQPTSSTSAVAPSSSEPVVPDQSSNEVADSQPTDDGGNAASAAAASGSYKLCDITNGQIFSCEGSWYQGKAVVFTDR